jgi:hypothetical protein
VLQQWSRLGTRTRKNRNKNKNKNKHKRKNKNKHKNNNKKHVQDMGDAVGPELRRLASLGASGRHLQNAERDLMRYVGDEAAWPNCV